MRSSSPLLHAQHGQAWGVCILVRSCHAVSEGSSRRPATRPGSMCASVRLHQSKAREMRADRMVLRKNWRRRGRQPRFQRELACLVVPVCAMHHHRQVLLPRLASRIASSAPSSPVPCPAAWMIHRMGTSLPRSRWKPATRIESAGTAAAFADDPAESLRVEPYCQAKDQEP